MVDEPLRDAMKEASQSSSTSRQSIGSDVILLEEAVRVFVQWDHQNWMDFGTSVLKAVVDPAMKCVSIMVLNSGNSELIRLDVQPTSCIVFDLVRRSVDWKAKVKRWSCRAPTYKVIFKSATSVGHLEDIVELGRRLSHIRQLSDGGRSLLDDPFILSRLQTYHMTAIKMTNDSELSPPAETSDILEDSINSFFPMSPATQEHFGPILVPTDYHLQWDSLCDGGYDSECHPDFVSVVSDSDTNNTQATNFYSITSDINSPYQKNRIDFNNNPLSSRFNSQSSEKEFFSASSTDYESCTSVDSDSSQSKSISFTFPQFSVKMDITVTQIGNQIETKVIPQCTSSSPIESLPDIPKSHMCETWLKKQKSGIERQYQDIINSNCEFSPIPRSKRDNLLQSFESPGSSIQSEKYQVTNGYHEIVDNDYRLVNITPASDISNSRPLHSEDFSDHSFLEYIKPYSFDSLGSSPGSSASLSDLFIVRHPEKEDNDGSVVSALSDALSSASTDTVISSLTFYPQYNMVELLRDNEQEVLYMSKLEIPSLKQPSVGGEKEKESPKCFSDNDGRVEKLIAHYEWVSAERASKKRIQKEAERASKKRIQKEAERASKKRIQKEKCSSVSSLEDISVMSVPSSSDAISVAVPSEVVLISVMSVPSSSEAISVVVPSEAVLAAFTTSENEDLSPSASRVNVEYESSISTDSDICDAAFVPDLVMAPCDNDKCIDVALEDGDYMTDICTISSPLTCDTEMCRDVVREISYSCEVNLSLQNSSSVSDSYNNDASPVSDFISPKTCDINSCSTIEASLTGNSEVCLDHVDNLAPSCISVEPFFGVQTDFKENHEETMSKSLIIETDLDMDRHLWLELFVAELVSDIIVESEREMRESVSEAINLVASQIVNATIDESKREIVAEYESNFAIMNIAAGMVRSIIQESECEISLEYQIDLMMQSEMTSKACTSESFIDHDHPQDKTFTVSPSKICKYLRTSTCVGRNDNVAVKFIKQQSGTKSVSAPVPKPPCNKPVSRPPWNFGPILKNTKTPLKKAANADKKTKIKIGVSLPAVNMKDAVKHKQKAFSKRKTMSTETPLVKTSFNRRTTHLTKKSKFC